MKTTPGTIPAPGAGSHRGTFRALRSRPFRRYFIGQVVSASGTFLQQTAIAWLVFRLTHSASSLGLVLAAGGLPSLVFGPWGGTVVDRVDGRRLLLVTQSLFAALAAALWALSAAGLTTVGVVVVLNVATGVVSIVDSPARQAFVSRLVQADDLSSAVSLNGVVMNSARVIGPSVAGALIATVGTTPCFAVNAVSYLAVLIALAAVHPVSAQSIGRHGGIRDGLRHARGRQQLWLPLLMMSVVGLISFNFSVILPVLASDTFHGAGGTYGLLSAMLSIGSVAGSIAVGFVHHPRRVYLVAAALGFGVALAATAEAPTVLVACILLVVTGFAAYSYVTLSSTTLQLHAAPAYRGRIMALWVFVYLGTTPVGSVLSGWLCSAAGPRAALLAGAGACALVGGIAARVHTPPDPDAALVDLRPSELA